MAKKSARKPNAAFMKPVTPDDKLAAVVGSKPMPRTELTKKIWDYIKKNNLQDKKDKKVSMFEMTKLVSGHVS
jgi:chromatin remodeling complex protein RSC6